jgi:hemerythrin-like metal-binding protein
MRGIFFSALFFLLVLTPPMALAQGDGSQQAQESGVSSGVSSLVDENIVKFLGSGWVEKQKDEEGAAEAKSLAKPSFSWFFWGMIAVVAALVVAPLTLSFGAVGRRVSLRIKLYNSHGSLLILALILGLCGYTYIGRITGISALKDAFVDLEIMINKLHKAQNSLLLYGKQSEKYAGQQIGVIKALMEEYEMDMKNIEKDNHIQASELQLVRNIVDMARAYHKSFEVMVAANNEVNSANHKADELAEEISKTLIGFAGKARPAAEAAKNLYKAEVYRARFNANKKLEHVEGIASFFSVFGSQINALRSYIEKQDEALYAKAYGEFDAYKVLIKKIVEQTAVVETESAKMSSIIAKMRGFSSSAMDGFNARSETLFTEAGAASAILILMALVVGIIPTIIVTRAITQPLGRVIGMIEEMGKGHLEDRLNLGRSDEIGQMACAMDGFADNLQYEVVTALQLLSEGDLTLEATPRDERDAIMGALKKTVDDLNHLVAGINEAGEQIAGGSRQLSDSSHALSEGSTEQASALEQITASMTGIASQTRHNADNASEANRLAGHSREAAEEGNARMGEMVSAMGEINQSSQSIFKIIKVIDEIAFQTNLLALNAAVEAARAGKHGKGFAVVAEEVRSLAARSAQAAKETAEMIESSVGKARKGSEIADKTALALGTIMTEVTKAADLVGEIADASNKQALAIDEVNRGVVEIDKVTQRNAAISEQTAAAAGELSENASRLKGMLSRFKLKSGGGKAALSPARTRGSLPPASGRPGPAKGEAGHMKWDPSAYGVGSQEMDGQHKRFFTMLSNLQSAERSGRGRDAIGMTLDGVMDYIKTHFLSEEEYMKKIGYPDLAGHRKRHEELSNDAQRLRNEYKEGKAKSVMKLSGFLMNWLHSHISKDDKKYGEYALRSGSPARHGAGREDVRTKSARGGADPRGVISLEDGDFSQF